LALLSLAEFVAVLDASIVNIALPSTDRGLHFSLTNVSWLVDTYVLTFGGFLLLGGRIADLPGWRRVFVVGLGVFSLSTPPSRSAAPSGWPPSRQSGPRGPTTSPPPGTRSTRP
jgi:MFS family permease